MTGDSLFTPEFIAELARDVPDIRAVKCKIVEAFRKETGRAPAEGLNADEEGALVVWLNRALLHPYGTSLFYRKTPFLLPFVSPSLSHLVFSIGQYHCPICSEEQEPRPRSFFTVRISAISKQAMAKRPKMRKAFEAAVAFRFREQLSERWPNDQPICAHIVFVLGRESRNMDVDNMAKAFLDALKGVVFEDDKSIVHLSVIKIVWKGDEDFLTLSLRCSKLPRFDNVIVPSMHHGWAGAEFLDLAQFMER